MAIIRIEGVPVISFEFIDLPSVNSHYNLNRWDKARFTAEWRYEAREKAQDHILWGDLEPIPRAMVLARVFPPFEEVSDVHNVHIKPLLDGFTDAGLWADDEWAFVPMTAFLWAGIGDHKPRERKKRRTVVDIYTLDAVYLDGVQQRLPAGRTRT